MTISLRLISAVPAWLLLFAGLTPPPRPARPARPEPTLLLCWVLGAENRVAYRAKQTVILSAGEGAQATVTYEMHDGRGRSRTVYLMPRSAAGRTVVNDGKWVWEYNPSRRLVIRSPIAAATPQDSAYAASRILRCYRLSVDATPSSCAGRSTWVMRITPLTKDRPSYAWWVDRTTYLVLRREVRDPDGELRSLSTCSSVDIGDAARRAPMAFVIPPDVHVVYEQAGQTATTLAGARRLAPSWARPPAASIGQGFDFDGAELVDVKAQPTMHVRYSDGLTTVSLIQMPGTTTMPGQGRLVRRVKVGRLQADLRGIEPFLVLSWRDAGSTFSLVADLAQPTLLELARRAQ